jgi:multidrug efflux system membrane fusion protein
MPASGAPRSLWRSIVRITVLVALAVGVAWWIETRQASQPAGGGARGGGGAAMSIVPATAANGDINIVLNALGTVTSLSTVTVRTQISGQLLNIDFKEGQDVKKGDPLAEIDSRPYEVTLQQAQGQLARDQALLDEAKLDLARYEKLAATNAISKQQYDQQESLVHQYEGAVTTDQGQIQASKLNITYCHIVAPADGRVGLRQVDQGNYVTPGDTNGIVLLTLLQPITVIFTLPEDNLPAVLARLQAGATLAATAYDRSATTELASGTLSTLDNQIDTTTGTFKLRAQFANEKDNLYPNQFVNIKLLVDTLHDAVVVPTSAIQRGAPGTYVYLVNADNTVSIRPIQLGPADGERVSVKSGLMAGDRMVVDGADKLRDGAKVVVREAPGAAPPAGDNPQQPRGQRGQGQGKGQGQGQSKQQSGTQNAPAQNGPAQNGP